VTIVIKTEIRDTFFGVLKIALKVTLNIPQGFNISRTFLYIFFIDHSGISSNSFGH